MEPKNIFYLSYETIIAASQNGDFIAMGLITQYYEKYITSLATKTLYDEYGETYLVVDEELRSRLERKLIYIVVNFQILTN